MNQKRIYLYPFFILLSIFVIDKSVCIPQFREAGRRAYKSGQNVLIGLPKVWEEDKKRQSENTKVIVVAGTSRSDIFHEWEKIPVNKNTYQFPTYFETRSSIKASEYFLFYLMTKSMIESDFKPDVLFLEFSEEMLNENNIFSYKSKWQELMLHEDELIDIFPAFNFKFQREILMRLAFISYNYHFSPIQGISNLIKGKTANDDTYFIALASYLNKKRPFNPKFVGIEIDNFTPQEYKDRIIDYSESQKERLLPNYAFSETEYIFLKKIIQLAEEQNIPMVIWEPQVHPYYNQIRKSITGGKLFESLSPNLVSSNSKNIRLISLNKGNTNCKTFLDSSHVSPICVPEIADKLLQTAKEIPNFK
ncbi:DUF1574 family protein [Leptospira meyeri]|uniref:DUF1574 family protein n=1 Tax=Leptospira meyeri TaxID=29508 RepID=UPI001083D6A5|nr:DUF1574 family protein [Leptospira meyeri]TGL15502.1 DUF1574 domain-containing protein [Leptospira meyeri]